ncbi:hypothetical protein B0H19DRAFT_1142618 [Mycena capillaripes]|nr:hypothetical protein B0H19DRAFT_1142618 [Mycena capillaripes]
MAPLPGLERLRSDSGFTRLYFSSAFPSSPPPEGTTHHSNPPPSQLYSAYSPSPPSRSRLRPSPSPSPSSPASSSLSIAALLFLLFPPFFVVGGGWASPCLSRAWRRYSFLLLPNLLHLLLGIFLSGNFYSRKAVEVGKG